MAKSNDIEDLASNLFLNDHVLKRLVTFFLDLFWILESQNDMEWGEGHGVEILLK